MDTDKIIFIENRQATGPDKHKELIKSRILYSEFTEQ